VEKSKMELTHQTTSRSGLSVKKARVADKVAIAVRGNPARSSRERGVTATVRSQSAAGSGIRVAAKASTRRRSSPTRE
jgi:hypothetical protein